jgi:hypothetical protein
MNASEIIANQANKEGKDPALVLASLKKVIEAGNSILLKEGDSVFLVTRAGGDAVEVVMFTADGAMALPNVVMSAIKKIKASGANVIYGDDEDAMFFEILQQIGVPVQPENSNGHTLSAQI